MKLPVVALSLVLCTGLAVANAPPPIRVITYNVQFLPGLASTANKRPEPDYRARRIAEEMSTFDIVALQETFEPQWREIILEGLKKNWNGNLESLVSPKPEDRFNGGCLIATRLPVLETGSTIYEHYSKPADYGFRADGYAAKGVIHARVAVSKEPKAPYVDVFVSHLEARADDLRPLQYKEMADFIAAESDPNAPLLLLGDLNTRGMKEERANPDSQYNQLMNELNRARPSAPMIDVWPHLKGDALGGTTEQESEEIGRRIDYIIVSNPAAPNPRLKPVTIAVNLYQDPKTVALSDHNAVIAEFHWELE